MSVCSDQRKAGGVDFAGFYSATWPGLLTPSHAAELVEIDGCRRRFRPSRCRFAACCRIVHAFGRLFDHRAFVNIDLSYLYLQFSKQRRDSDESDDVYIEWPFRRPQRPPDPLPLGSAVSRGLYLSIEPSFAMSGASLPEQFYRKRHGCG